MDNFFRINNTNELLKIFENVGNRLISILFRTDHSHNIDCTKTLQAFEKSSKMNTTTFFCIVETDKIKIDSVKYFNSKINNCSKIEFYYLGNLIDICISSDEMEIENHVKKNQQYVMIQNNSKNGISNIQQLNPTLIQQQILMNAQMTNPQYFQYLINNPLSLQQLVQKQLLQSQNTPVIQQPNVTFVPNNIPTPSNNHNDSIFVPTPQQMHQMFQMFQMLQQMGVLNMNIPKNVIEDNINKQSDFIELPNGDKVIKLANGKYGLISKKN